VVPMDIVSHTSMSHEYVHFAFLVPCIVKNIT